MSKPRLTATEARCVEFMRPADPREAEEAARRGFAFHLTRSRGGTVTVRQWHDDGRILGSAGGYGYDKASHVLAGVLRWLPGLDEEQAQSVWATQSAGVEALSARLLSLGWDSVMVGDRFYVWRLGNLPPMLWGTASAKIWEEQIKPA